MAGVTREAPVNSSPAVASHAEGEEIEVLESTDVLPVAPEDVSLHTCTVPGETGGRGRLQCTVTVSSNFTITQLDTHFVLRLLPNKCTM